jgi:hypothetical protein
MPAWAARAVIPCSAVVVRYGFTCEEPPPKMYCLAAGPITAIEWTFLALIGRAPLLRMRTEPPSAARLAAAISAA